MWIFRYRHRYMPFVPVALSHSDFSPSDHDAQISPSLTSSSARLVTEITGALFGPRDSQAAVPQRLSIPYRHLFVCQSRWAESLQPIPARHCICGQPRPSKRSVSDRQERGPSIPESKRGPCDVSRRAINRCAPPQHNGATAWCSPERQWLAWLASWREEGERAGWRSAPVSGAREADSG